jgi:hypothetical protein
MKSVFGGLIAVLAVVGCSANRPSSATNSPVTVTATVTAMSTPQFSPTPDPVTLSPSVSFAARGLFVAERLRPTGVETAFYNGCPFMLMYATNTTGHDQRVIYTLDAVWEMRSLYNQQVFREVPDTNVVVTFGTKDSFGYENPSGSVTGHGRVCPPAEVASLGALVAMRWRLVGQSR